jgi:hypothetical protein
MANSYQANSDPGRWRTVQSALSSWSRTVRLCLIYLVWSTPVGALIWLIRH